MDANLARRQLRDCAQALLPYCAHSHSTCAFIEYERITRAAKWPDITKLTEEVTGCWTILRQYVNIGDDNATRIEELWNGTQEALDVLNGRAIPR